MFTQNPKDLKEFQTSQNSNKNDKIKENSIKKEIAARAQKEIQIFKNENGNNSLKLRRTNSKKTRNDRT